MSSQPLLLLTRRAVLSSAPPTRAFSSAPALLSKASRARTTKPQAKPPQPSAIPDSLRGTGAGADARLYGPGDVVLGRDEVRAPVATEVEEPAGVQAEPAAPAAETPVGAHGGQTQLESDAGTSCCLMGVCRWRPCLSSWARA